MMIISWLSLFKFIKAYPLLTSMQKLLPVKLKLDLLMSHPYLVTYVFTSSFIKCIFQEVSLAKVFVSKLLK